MTVELRFQGPGDLEDTLLSELLEAAEDAHSGGGLFAWANTHGAHALFGNPIFKKFLSQSPFELVVGTDLITDAAAVTALQEWQTEFATLAIRAFVHESAPIFHPKMAWFEVDGGLRLIVGSGNFTRGGMQANWEIYTNSFLVGEEADQVRRQIKDWLSQHEDLILDLADPLVAAQVEGNAGNERSLRRKSRTPGASDADPELSVAAAGDAILVSELSKNRKLATGESAFSQASFPRVYFEGFFNVHGPQNDVLLYPVDASGAAGVVESTNGRHKPKSANYYFELQAAAGIAHSGKEHPPIAVFLKLETGAFLYLFRLPGEVGYDELDALLQDTDPPRGNQLRRSLMDRAILQAFWPSCPLLAAREPGS